MVQVYFTAGATAWAEYEGALRRAFAEAGLEAALSAQCDDPTQVDYIISAPGGVVEDFSPFTRCKAVLNLWAGVERLVGNATLTQPLCRMVDPALTQGMVEYVLGHVMRHHLGMDRYILGAAGWKQIAPPLAQERVVAILGLGALGAACGAALAAVGFEVIGWSRSAKTVAGIACYHGADGLQAVLSRAAILVTLLPRTEDTENLLDAARLAQLPPGAIIINPGRGALIDDTALLAALESGHIAHATLDVFRIEPLPDEHPYRKNPHVTITPHIAADTRAPSAAKVIAANILRGEAGLPFAHLVDRVRGY